MMRKIAGLAAVAGTTLFVISFTLHGFLRADYSPVRNYVSELAIGATGWVQIVSFLILGACMIVFAFGIGQEFPSGRASRAAPILFGIMGISYILSGLFVTDPQAMFDNQQTPHGMIHGLVGAVVFSLSATVCFVLWRRFRREDAWKSLSGISLAAGVIMTILIVLMKIGQLQDGVLHEGAGVVQRCCLITSYVWIDVIACKMVKQG